VRATPEAETRLSEGESSAVRSAAPLPCAPGDSPFHIKGGAYRGFLVLVNKALPGGVEALCAALPDPRLAPFIRQPFMATSRYDVLPFHPLSVTLARRLSTPVESMIRTATAMQARYDAKTVYKRIFDATQVSDIADRIGRFNRQYYDFGQFTGTLLGSNRVESRSEGIPAYIASWFAPMHGAYTEEGMRIAGAREVALISQSIEPSGRRDGYPLVTVRMELRWQ
jgi:hypothetical protein